MFISQDILWGWSLYSTWSVYFLLSAYLPSICWVSDVVFTSFVFTNSALWFQGSSLHYTDRLTQTLYIIIYYIVIVEFLDSFYTDMPKHTTHHTPHKYHFHSLTLNPRGSRPENHGEIWTRLFKVQADGLVPLMASRGVEMILGILGILRTGSGS